MLLQDIIRDLFVNLSIMISTIFIASQIPIQEPNEQELTYRSKTIFGLVGGLLGYILMQFSIQIENMVIDLRHVPLIIVAYYFGLYPTLLSIGVIQIGRIMFGWNSATILSFVLITMVAAGALTISKLKLPQRQKVFYIFTINNIVFSIIILFLIKIELLFKILTIYWITSYLGGFIAFYLINYLSKSNRLFKKYKEQSNKDFLTGLHNYRTFDETFNQLINRTEKNNEELSLLYLDIDHFKKVNDTYGHNAGDRVLQIFSQIIQDHTRSFDFVSRNGGEEFTVLLPDCPTSKAVLIGERIRKAVENHRFILPDGQAINITTSVGVSNFPEKTVHAEDLKDDADQALYKAKNSGRNRICVFNTQ